MKPSFTFMEAARTLAITLLLILWGADGAKKGDRTMVVLTTLAFLWLVGATIVVLVGRSEEARKKRERDYAYEQAERQRQWNMERDSERRAAGMGIRYHIQHP